MGKYQIIQKVTGKWSSKQEQKQKYHYVSGTDLSALCMYINSILWYSFIIAPIINRETKAPSH